ncbi:MAG: hypothetical protein F6K19_07625, partial [Cyanothece sp. SIO1E1]|nr:hypothetical protein [Cyanothece sp. SIO1E1]
NQCTFTGAPEVTEPPALALDPVIVNITCFGDQDGSIDPQVSGGTPPYSYAWSNGATSPTLSDLGPGSYSLVVTDANDCVLQSEPFEILEPTQLTVSGEVTNATSCATSPDGAIILSVSGGTPDYTYAWSTGATTKDLSGLSGGTYTVTVTDANDCEQIENFTVNEPSSLSVEVTQVDVLCNGDATGSLSLSISGGLAPYSVLWSDGTTGTERQNLAAGIYGYTVTDANQCTFTGAPEITEPPALALDPVIVNIMCFGDQNGSIDPQVSGGTPPYTYAWSNGATTPTLSDLGPGSYSLVVTDANDCVLQSEPFEILEPGQLVVSGEITDATSCATAPDGAIVLTVEGGTPDYTYAWSTGATTKDLSGLSGGTYTVTVTDANDCEQIENFTVNEPSSLSVEVTQVDVLCNGDTTGSLSLSISGGLPPYTILWSDGTAGTERQNLAAGIYGYTVTDANQCTFMGAPEITEPPALALDPVIVNITCFGDQNGSIDPQVSGGTPPYTYAWSNGATSPTLSDLGPGSYSLVVTDANDCVLQSEPFEILEPAQLVISGEITDATSCATAPDGAIVLTVEGGTPDYTYAWSTGATTKDLSGLSGGTYTVTVTDANDCEQTESFTVNEPSFLSVEVTQVDVFCNGDATGSLSLSISGGLAPYSVLWSDGTTSTERQNLAAGIYGYTVTDANQCTFMGAPEITEPPALALDPVIVNITCFGDQNGSIDPQVSGGTPPYTYAWSNGATSPTLSDLGPGSYSVVVTDANDCILQSEPFEILEPVQLVVSGEVTDATSCATAPDGAIVLTVEDGTPDYTYAWSTGATTKDLSGLSGGTYTVTVTDANDCEQTESFTVNEPSSLSVEVTQVDVFCNGDATGSLSLSISGGLAPYSVVWSDGTTGTERQNLAAGIYGYTVTDANQCTFTGAPEITEPPALALDPVIVDVTCFEDQNGSIDPQVSGGTPPYSYAWSNGTTTPTLSDLGPGSYSLLVTDASDCVLQSEPFEILEPTQLIVRGEVTNATSCATAPDGAIVLTVEGGTPDYTYAWSTGATTKDLSGLSGGTYTVTVTDANDCEQTESFTVNEPSSLSVEVTQVDVFCNGDATGSLSLSISGGLAPYSVVWSDGTTGTERQNLAAGIYGYTVTDANQCTFTGAPEITEPPALALDPVIVNITCFEDQNGSIDPQVSGGTPPYSYTWSNGATTPTLSDLGPGTYSLVVTDANDCVLQSDPFTIIEPEEIVIEGTVTNATSCDSAPDGAIDVTVSGGTGDYTYLWSTGATDQDLIGIGGGTYTLTVTDENACEQVANFTVTEPSSISAEVTVSPVSCFGEEDGLASLVVTGGLPPYSFLWSDGSTDQDRTGLAAGVYDVTITDSNNCTFLAQAAIESPDDLEIIPEIINISCASEVDGRINLTLVGGTPPYTFAWSNGATTQDIQDLDFGDYTVIVSDANDCVYESNTFSISAPAALEIQSVVVDATACGNGSDGSISLSVTGGTGAYTYLWNTGDQTPDLDNIGPGIYTVTVTDENNCSATHERTVNQPQGLEVVASTTNTSCVDATDGTISLEISRGIPPYSILWDDQSTTTTTRANLLPGTYSYTVSDANNCEEIGQAVVETPPPLTIEATILPVSCAGEFDGGIVVVASGGTGGYRFEWSNDRTTPVNNALPAGEYTLLLRDANDCLLDTTFVLTEPPALFIEDFQVTDAACSGIANGAIDITVVGGVEPYSFSWSNGATTEDLVDVEGGEYTVTITDASGCEYEDFFGVLNTSELSASAETQAATCDEANGNILLEISGGTEPYSFDWSIDGSGDNDDVQNPSEVPAGTYQVTIRDAAGCSIALEDITVEGKAAPVLSLVSTEQSVCGEASGSAVVNLQGGAAPFTFNWSNGSTEQNLSGVDEGTYTLLVTDADQCEATLEVVITCFDPCSLAVGTMGQEKLMGCQSQILTATYDPTNEIVGEGEVRLFVIHDASGDMLGSSILNVSTDPTITYTSALSPNVEYYLSAVVGKDDGNGLVDFNNSCLAVAPGTPFSFAPAPNGPAQLIATNSTLCPGQQLELKVEVQIDGDPSYVWDTPKGIITTTIPELIVNNFGAEDVGEYLVAYNIGGCDSEQLGPLVVTLDGGAGEVSAGEDVTLCGDGSFVLEGTMPEGATGTWFTTSPAFIEDENDPNSFVDSLVNGINTFYWIVNTGSCLTRDTVEVYHAVAPTTQDRSITMEANQATLLLNKKALFDQITQSIPDSNLTFSIIQEPDEGQLTVDDEASQLIYQRDLDIEGDLDLEFIYEVCNVDPECGELCSQSTITLAIKYLETEIISYKKGLRPDGKSPTWNITLLRDLTEAKLTIVDRWGKLIHSEEYLPEDNLSKGNMLEAWDGRNFAGVSMFTGAYYFIFEGTPTSGDKPIVVKGIVYLLK